MIPREPTRTSGVEGFSCNIFSGTATVTKAVGTFSGLGDGSYIGPHDIWKPKQYQCYQGSLGEQCLLQYDD